MIPQINFLYYIVLLHSFFVLTSQSDLAKVRTSGYYCILSRKNEIWIVAHKNVFHTWHQTNSISMPWIKQEPSLFPARRMNLDYSAHGILLTTLLESKVYRIEEKNPLPCLKESPLPPLGGDSGRESPDHPWLFPHTQKRKHAGWSQAKCERSRELRPLMLLPSY